MGVEAALIAMVTALATSMIAAAVADRRFRREFRLEYKAESAALRLLKDPRYRFRTFKTLQHHLGGFEDDELRRILVRAGAIRFKDEAGVEIWSLIERSGDLLDAEYGTKGN